MLIQPQPLPFQLLAEGFLPFSGSSGFLVGLALTIAACLRLGLAVTPLWLLRLLLYLALHAALLLGQSFLYGALAFWKPVACEEISSMILDLNNQLGKFPLFGIPRGLLAFLCTALPVCVAAAFVAAAAAMFRKGLRHYLEYSCNRYKEMGHRN